MKYCKTCKHWDKIGNEYSKIIGARKCNYVIHTEDATEWNKDYGRVIKPEYQDTKAFSVDGSGYYAALFTKENFGCNQYSPAPANKED